MKSERLAKRFVSLWLPYWPVDRLRRVEPNRVRGDAPLALVASGGRGIEVTAVNPLAAAQGVQPGLALADARALLPGLITLAADSKADQEDLARLAQWCGRYGPQRHVDGADGIWIDVTGVPHLFGGEAGLLQDITSRIAGFGVHVRAGLADTFAAASALARFGTVDFLRPRSMDEYRSHGGRPRRRAVPACEAVGDAYAIAAPAASRDALAGLPVEALRLAPDVVLLLKRLGLKRIGQLYDVPRAALQQRFNDARFARRKKPTGRGGKDAAMAAAVLLRLDQALGSRAEPLKAQSEPPLLAVRETWSDPLISADGIAAEVHLLAERLVSRLGDQGLGCRSVRLSLFRTDGTVARVGAGTSTACRDAGHLMRLLEEKFATVDAGFGVDVALIEALSAEPLGDVQQELAAGDAGERVGGGVPAAMAGLVDRLTNRFGGARVQVLAACASHVPERAECLRPASEAVAALRVSPFLRPHASAADGRPQSPRPLFLMPVPQPIIIEGGQKEGPVCLVWRRVRHRIAAMTGPERIAPEWWRDIGRPPERHARVRDYYRAATETGASYWIFREVPPGAECEGEAEGMRAGADAGGRVASRSGGGWFLHGIFGGHTA